MVSLLMSSPVQVRTGGDASRVPDVGRRLAEPTPCAGITQIRFEGLRV
jgi:hypothetical protein